MKSKPSKAFFLFAGLAAVFTVHAQNSAVTRIDPGPFADAAHHWYDISDKGNTINARPGRPKYAPTELVNIADNILLYQKTNGGWPKNYDVFAILAPDQKDSLLKAKNQAHTTYDNGSTYTHITALAQVFTATGVGKYRDAALQGLDFVLESQYKNGGFPQYYPLESNYSRYITYNDGNFTGILTMLRDIAEQKPQFSFVDGKRRERLVTAYQKALECVLNTQINDAGVPTAWCQQYNEVTLQPAWARKFEPAGICNGESADLVLFLMTLDRPTKEVRKAITDAVAWFEASKILNTRVNVVQAPRMVTDYRVSTTDREVVNDPSAPPIWTRFYELKTHKPMFCNRDSKIVYTLAEVARERRDGYAWYTYAPQKVLDRYADWLQRVSR